VSLPAGAVLELSRWGRKRTAEMGSGAHLLPATVFERYVHTQLTLVDREFGSPRVSDAPRR
jgi:hypothetical protein